MIYAGSVRYAVRVGKLCATAVLQIDTSWLLYINHMNIIWMYFKYQNKASIHLHGLHLEFSVIEENI